MIKSILLVAFFTFPLGIAAQTYKESVLAPGADASRVERLTAEQNLKIHLHRVIGPESLLSDALSAGLNELRNDPGAWTRDGDGYAKRFGSQAGRNGVREMLGFGLDSALHTDPRVYRSTHPHFLGRLCDALSQVVITRTDSGGRAPAIANVASAFAAGQIQTIWMPANDAHTRNGLVSGGIMLLGDASRNVMREFWPDIERKFRHRD